MRELDSCAARVLPGESLIETGGACGIALTLELLGALGRRRGLLQGRGALAGEEREAHGDRGERDKAGGTHGVLNRLPLPGSMPAGFVERRGIIVPVEPGRLDVVATPIGNLGDLSPRARATLLEADLIVAEDTRRTGQLLAALGETRPLVSLHAHNERSRVAGLLERLRGGARIALVSDAGTPVLSDPGFELVQAAVQAGFDVRTVPGVSAITAALSIAAIPADRFCFEGFLPAKPRERRGRLAQLAQEPRTLVFFEAPHRIIESLTDLAAAFGSERRAAVGRELTKVFETMYRGTLGELAARASCEPDFARGELTLVVRGAAGEEPAEGTCELDRLLTVLTRELPPAKAAAIAAQLAGVRRADAYRRALVLAGRNDGGADA